MQEKECADEADGQRECLLYRLFRSSASLWMTSRQKWEILTSRACRQKLLFRPFNLPVIFEGHERKSKLALGFIWGSKYRKDIVCSAQTNTNIPADSHNDGGPPHLHTAAEICIQALMKQTPPCVVWSLTFDPRDGVWKRSLCLINPLTSDVTASGIIFTDNEHSRGQKCLFKESNDEPLILTSSQFYFSSVKRPTSPRAGPTREPADATDV